MNEIAASVPADGQSLSRSLRPRHVTMITIGGIIGAGLFVGSSAAIAAAGPAILISYVLTGLLVLLIMRMLGEMAVGMPHIRSFTEFARAGLGNWAGFSVGWLYWYFWVIVIPVEAIAGATIIQAWVPLPAWQIGVGLMALMTAVNLLSARAYGEFEFWFASIKVTAIIAFIVVAAAYAFGFRSPTGPTFANLVAHGGFAPHGALAALAAVTTVIFSMMGAEIVTIAAVESTEPARAVARMTSSVIGRILIFYVGSILMVVSVVPWNLVVPGQSPFTLALDTMHIPYASTIMAWIILTAVLSCLNSAFYVASRVLFVLAANGDAPRWLVRTNKRHVPARSVLLASVAGFAGVIAAILSPSLVFAFLLNASGALIVYIYLAIAVSQVRVRRQAEREGKPASALPMWLFPWLSYVAMAGMIAVLIAMAITPSHRAEFWASAVSVLLALTVYRFVRAPSSTSSPRFRLLKKIALIAGGSIAAILVVAIIAIYGISTWKLNARHEIAGLGLRLMPAPSMVEEGKRLAHVNGCLGCHGEDLAGHLFVDKLFIGRLSGHNLTRYVPQYTDEQLTNAIRGGIKSDGTGNIFMPSHAMVRLADADIAAIIAYLRTVGPLPDAAKDTSLGLLARALVAVGMIPVEPDIVDPAQLGPRERPTGADAMGPYIARTTCAMCHGLDLHGEEQVESPNLFAIVPAYSLADFRTLLSSGIAMGGRKLGLMTEMSQGALKYMSDDEVAAVYAYLSAPEVATKP